VALERIIEVNPESIAVAATLIGWSGDMLNFAKVTLLLALLLVFAAVGFGCAFNPDWSMRHFGRSLMGGGELREEWNRMQISAVGLVFAGFALYLIYILIFR